MEPKTIPEDLMLEMQDWLDKGQRIFREMNAINERNQDNEYREWSRDYERSIAC